MTGRWGRVVLHRDVDHHRSACLEGLLQDRQELTSRLDQEAAGAVGPGDGRVVRQGLAGLARERGPVDGPK